MDAGGMNPFKPGPGRKPPLRAGHDYPARFLATDLISTREGESIGSVFLHGPPGTGKTALLGETRTRALEEGIRVIELEWSRNAVPADGAWVLATPGKPEGRMRVSDLGKTLLSLAQDSPVLFLIDDAHELPARIGAAILGTARRLLLRRLPMFTLLAGPPGILNDFEAAGAGHIATAPLFCIGLLESCQDVQSALSVPAQESGLPMDQDALDLLAAESQGYPYHLQLLGHSAWDAASSRGGDRIAIDDAREGARVARDRLVESFRPRLDELRALNLMREAALVSRALAGRGDNPRLSHRELCEVLGDTGPYEGPATMGTIDSLGRAGLIWHGSAGAWVPGIPALWEHICEEPG